MSKKFSVCIVGIPIDMFKFDEYYYFKKNLTSQLRLGTKNSIEKRSKQQGLIVEVTDLGELVDSEYQKRKSRYIPRRVFDNLAQNFKEIVDDFDFILVYGGVHNAAYVLYHLKDRVERYDIHDDAGRNNFIGQGSYMRYAVYLPNRIKHCQVSHHGEYEILDERRWGDLGSTRTGLPTEVASGKIFDIDVDYYTHTGFHLGQSIDINEERRRVAGIKQAIRNARPRVIGIFEYQRLDASLRGYRRILDFAWEGTLARLNSMH